MPRRLISWKWSACIPQGVYPVWVCAGPVNFKPAYRPRGVYELRVRSGAAPLRTGSSPGCAAAAAAAAAVGSRGSSVRGAAPSRGCSAVGSSPLLRWRSSGCRYRPCYRCRRSHRCHSWRNDRSQTETATESSGGPWLKEEDEGGGGWMWYQGRMKRWTPRSLALQPLSFASWLTLTVTVYPQLNA